MGAGVHRALTGHGNVFVKGGIDQPTAREVEQQFDDWITLAKTEIYVDNPPRTYIVDDAQSNLLIPIRKGSCFSSAAGKRRIVANRAFTIVTPKQA